MDVIILMDSYKILHLQEGNTLENKQNHTDC